jgi:sec-independent protein translocase protein TatA
VSKARPLTQDENAEKIMTARGAGRNKMLGLGSNELMIVLVIVLVLFGGAKIPQMMKGLGEGMREFKKAAHDDENPKETKV